MSSQDQHEATVDKLPDEILLKIFEAMDSVTLKNLCLVCKKFVFSFVHLALLLF